MSKPVISVRNLSVGFPDSDFRVVENVSFDVHAGEIMCVVGESGSGKSVTSMAIMGLLDKRALKPVAGEILLLGEDLTKAMPGRLRDLRATSMSMIFQEPMTALNPLYKVGKQIEEVLRAHGRSNASDRRTKVIEILKEVHLPDPQRIYGSFPHQLSGGQRQRVMIAMALILEPKLLIADEPTTALDVTTQKQITKLIVELCEKRRTAVVFITHDMGLVTEIGHRVTVMKAGSVVETGPVQAIIERPENVYTRSLLTAVPSLVPKKDAPDLAKPIILQTRGLCKTYSQHALFSRSRKVWAAKQVDVTLRAGSTVGIVGESGSGKSTVARCIVRLLKPSSGSIAIRGSQIEGLSPRGLKPYRSKIQFVFQDPNRSLNPRLTIADSLVEGPVTFGMKRTDALVKAAQILEQVGLPPDSLRRFPHQFSGGQRQRIAIARALITEPDILVADEAVSALDVSVQAQVLKLLHDLQAKLNIGILFITHDLRVAAQICDEVIVMKSGSVIEAGPTREVLVNPQNDYTRQLIDAAPGRHWDFANFRAVQ